MNSLLDAVQEVEPFGMNLWAKVENIFNDWATCNDRSLRDIDSLKAKFDRLTNVTKPTGDSSCPLPVRRAKRISGAIMAKAAAVSLGSADDVVGDSDGDSKEVKSSSIGVRRDRQTPGKTGVKVRSKKKDENDSLIKCVEEMVENISSMSTAVISDGTIPFVNIQDEIKKAVEEATKPMNEAVH